MSLIKGIHHVCLKCANKEEYKEVVHFYHEILELEIARTWSEGIMFQFGNAVLEVFANGGEKAEGGACPWRLIPIFPCKSRSFTPFT